MTLQDLSRYYKLREQLSRDEEILSSFMSKACPGAQVLTGMPHASGVSDKVGDLAAEIADMRSRIEDLRKEIAVEEQRVTAFISAIKNDQTRMIFRLRFLRCLTWGEVADVIGGRNTEGGVQKICYRYLAAQGCTDVGGDVC